MKKIGTMIIMSLVLLIMDISASAQQGDSLSPSVIQPFPLQVGIFKTTSLVFPGAIKSVDRGSKDLLVQKANGLDNILQVKAAKESFDETSLTVVTSDGRLYAFIVNYTEKPVLLNLRFGKTAGGSGDAVLSGQKHNEAVVKHYAETAALSAQVFRSIDRKKHGMHLGLNGIFIHDDVMYLRVRAENRSDIGYDIDQLRFFIRDEKKSRRTASQEIELEPLLIFQDTPQITPFTGNTFVLAFPKFTIPDNKYLVVQMMEGNGGRHLEIPVKGKVLMRAKGF